MASVAGRGRVDPYGLAELLEVAPASHLVLQVLGDEQGIDYRVLPDDDRHFAVPQLL